MQRLTLNGQETDCLEIAYAERRPALRAGAAARLVSALRRRARARARRCTASARASWQKTKARAKQAIQDMAEGADPRLRRAPGAARATPSAPDTVWQRELEASFPYEETPDQLQRHRGGQARHGGGAADGPPDLRRRRLRQDRGGDPRRLQGGAGRQAGGGAGADDDPRAAAPAAPSASASPTSRCKVEVLSRFRTPEAAEGGGGARSPRGEVDIVIGTHRLLSKDVRFQRPRAWWSSTRSSASAWRRRRSSASCARTVDVLTLTATPIPRTLNLSLAGARDMSVIETPPRDRLPVHTEIVELRRGGRSPTPSCARWTAAGRSSSSTTASRPSTTRALRLQKLVPQVRIARRARADARARARARHARVPRPRAATCWSRP